MEFTIHSIAHIENGYTDKFGIPRQSNLVNGMISKIVFEGEYKNREALRGMEEFSHLWIIWQFSKNAGKPWNPTVRPPRLGGNERRGVFATRSPFRPNSLGLSSVKIEKVEYDTSQGPVIYVSGADLMDGTPIFDIKPYIPISDLHNDAKGGFSEDKKEDHLILHFEEEQFCGISKEKMETILQVLEGDPRPGYHEDPERVYGFYIYDKEVKFRVDGADLFLLSISDC